MDLATPSPHGRTSSTATCESPATAAVVALVGNPNTGKTALFNALTGFHRHVANYPGVTVEVARGRIRGAARPIELLDLPGTYSLAAQSPDEAIVCQTLCGRASGTAPAAIIATLDASNPARNLYLVSQLLELELPLIIALNMVDIARRRGLEVDAARLAARLGVPVVPVVAVEPATVAPLVRALEQVLAAPSRPTRRAALPPALEEATRTLTAMVPDLRPGEAVRLLVDRDGWLRRALGPRDGLDAALAVARQRLGREGFDAATAEVRARYAWVDGVLDGVVRRMPPTGETWTARIDRVVTHPVGGGVTLLGVLYAVFYAIYWGAAPLVSALERLFGWAGAGVAAVVPSGPLQSLLVDGVIAGVGGVVGFLPQILILFLALALLEDCGYMARAAFMVDRLMRPLGLSGRAFIPLLSAFACAVPAILGTRAIADRRERFITILIAPFMSCSARLPVYVLLIGAFVPPTAYLGGWLRLDALVMIAMYLVGVVVAIPVALLLRYSAFRGPPAGFLLEMPSYKRPRLRAVVPRVLHAGRSFLVRAGTIILLVNVIVWALGYFPRSERVRAAVEAERAAQGWDDATYEAALAGAYLRDSYLGRLGRGLEPVLAPLHWDWRIGIGVIASFPAREVIVATLGTICNLGPEDDAESASLRTRLAELKWDGTDRPLFTLPVALSLMVFFALCAQCASTLVVIGRETGSWSWPVISFVGMTLIAYAGAWAVGAAARAVGW